MSRSASRAPRLGNHSATRWAGFTAAALLLSASSASALGLKYGLRLGGGTGIHSDDKFKDDITAFAVGGAIRLDLVLLAIEADVLWRRNTWETGGQDAEIQRVGIPVTARFGFPLVPGFLSAEIGAGLEPRFLLSAEFGGVDFSKDLNDQVLYLPLVLGIDLDLKVIGAGLEVRYEHQLTSESSEDQDEFMIHQFMVFGGVFF